METETGNIATEIWLWGAILLAGLFALAAMLHALHDAWQQGRRRKRDARTAKQWGVARRDEDD